MRHHHFLFGAGASAFSGPCWPHRPPLGAGLFAELKPLLRCAPSIEAGLEAMFKTDFEEAMDFLWRSNGALVQSFQQDLARYFLRFHPSHGNYYKTLLALLYAKKRRALLSTLNYDLLIERSLQQLGLRATHGFDKTPAYRVLVLKLHGSCNLIPDMGPTTITDISIDTGPPPPPGQRHVGVGGFPLKSATLAEMRAFLHARQTVVPSIAIYHRSKAVRDCPQGVERIQNFWKGALRDASKLFIIGVRLVEHDHHIWDAIAACNTEIFWVSPDAAAAKRWARSNDARLVHVCNSFKDFIPYYARNC